jgi:hypothetical protein
MPNWASGNAEIGIPSDGTFVVSDAEFDFPGCLAKMADSSFRERHILAFSGCKWDLAE